MFSISRGKSPQIVKSSCLSLLLFSSFIASTPVFAVDAVTQPVSFSCANFLHHTGLQDVLEQIPRWIDAEIAASNGFLAGKPELAAQIKQRLMQQFVDQGQHALCAKAAEAVGEANVELAGSRLAVPVFEQLSGLRSTALKDDEHFNEYQKKMRGVQPLETRQEWIRKLDMASGVTAFKAAVWVELRKTVLWSVGNAGGKRFSEVELDHELIGFQREVTERMQQETSAQWLFAYRSVPDSTFEQLFAVLDQAATQKTAAAMLAAVGVMGREVRQ